jgi:hypothetical protein
MKFNYLYIIAGFIFPVMTVYAQGGYVEDALRYSQTTVNGSARFQGMGGANTALGADVSSVSSNPAGLGFFRKSEVSFSPALSFANSRSEFKPYSEADPSITKDSKINFNVPNFGIVFASPKPDIAKGNWRGGSFGISFNRLNSFQNRFTYSGRNDQSSFTDYLADQAYNLAEEELLVPTDQIGYNVDNSIANAQLGFITYLIDPLPPQDGPDTDTLPNDIFQYKSAAGNQYLVTDQKETVTTTGAMNQWSFSYGGNWADKLYFGASIGLVRLRYGYEKEFSEQIIESDIADMEIRDFTYTNYYDMSGNGINATLGLIYKPNDIIRFGGSITTPTYFYNLREEYHSDMDVNFTDGGNEYQETVISNFEYTLTTPFRASGGLAVFLGKHGFVSADAEYVTYNKSKLGNESRVLRDANESIANTYQSAINFRVGGEFRQDILRLRAGAGYFGDPYKEGYDDLDRSRLNFTAGVGIRLPEFYIDLAIVHNRYKSGYTPYSYQFDPSFEGFPYPTASIRNSFTNAVITIGTFF